MYNTQQSKGWDDSAQLLSKVLSPIDKDQDKEIIILDIASGAGQLSIYASKKYRNSKIIAIGFSSKMLEYLRNYIVYENSTSTSKVFNNIELKLMDSQNLDSIKDSTVDYTFSIFDLIFFLDRIKGIELKSNGKTEIASWCKESFLPTVYQKTMNELLESTDYQQTALSLCYKEVFENELKLSGFKDIQIIKVKHLIEVNEITDLTKTFSTNPAYRLY